MNLKRWTVGDLKKFLEENKVPDDVPLIAFGGFGNNCGFKRVRGRLVNGREGENNTVFRGEENDPVYLFIGNF